MFGAVLAVLKAVLAAVWHVLVLVFKLLYGTLKFLRIRLLALYVLAMAVLSLFLPVFSGENLVWFWVGFALCALCTVLSWVGWLRKKHASRPRGTEEPGEEAPEESAPEKSPKASPPPPVYPRYFDVEGRAEYFFAEYEDRYELFYRGEHGAEYVRTDYKRKNEGA